MGAMDTHEPVRGNASKLSSSVVSSQCTLTYAAEHTSYFELTGEPPAILQIDTSFAIRTLAILC